MGSEVVRAIRAVVVGAVQRSHVFSNEFARLNGVIEDLRFQLDEFRRRDEMRSEEIRELTGQIRKVELAVSPRPRPIPPRPPRRLWLVSTR